MLVAKFKHKTKSIKTPTCTLLTVNTKVFNWGATSILNTKNFFLFCKTKNHSTIPTGEQNAQSSTNSVSHRFILVSCKIVERRKGGGDKLLELFAEFMKLFQTNDSFSLSLSLSLINTSTLFLLFLCPNFKYLWCYFKWIFVRPSYISLVGWWNKLRIEVQEY